MIDEKVLAAIDEYGRICDGCGQPEADGREKQRLIIEIENYANEMAIEGLKQAAERIVSKATQTGKGRE